MIPLLRLADLRDLADAELRRHIFVRFMRPSEDDVPTVCEHCGGQGSVVTEYATSYVATEECSHCDGAGRMPFARSELAHAEADPTDAELAQRIGSVLVAYESVGDWGCDSSAYFLIERDGELYEVHASHDSTCGFEGQWEPRPVTPSYLVSEHWRMSVGGYDEHRESGVECETCEGEHYVFTEDGYAPCRACDGSGRIHDVVNNSDLSTREVVMLWLHRRFGGELAEQPFALPEWAIPTWARHVDEQGDVVDLRAVDDRYLLNIVRWACRKVRGHWRKRYVYEVHDGEMMQQVVVVGPHDEHDLARAINVSTTLSGAYANPLRGEVIVPSAFYPVVKAQRERPPARGSFVNAMREVEARGLLPTWDELRVAADLAEFRGAMVYRPIASDEVSCVPIEGGPWDLVDLWVGYKLLAFSDASG